MHPFDIKGLADRVECVQITAREEHLQNMLCGLLLVTLIILEGVLQKKKCAVSHTLWVSGHKNVTNSLDLCPFIVCNNSCCTIWWTHFADNDDILYAGVVDWIYGSRPRFFSRVNL